MKNYNNSFGINNIERLKNKVFSGETLSINWRIQQLKKIDHILDNYRIEIINSLSCDLGKSKIEALAEILLVKEEIYLTKNNLRAWMKPKNINTPFYLFPSSSKVVSYVS